MNNNGGFEFEYTEEQLKTYMKSSTKFKLQWLEEIHNLTFKVLTPKEIEIRNKIRKGIM